MLVYLAGPVRDKRKWRVRRNVARARRAAQRILAAGHSVVCPHTMFEGWTDEDRILSNCLTLVQRCDALCLLPGWIHSTGTLFELGAALEAGKRVYWTEAELLLN